MLIPHNKHHSRISSRHVIILLVCLCITAITSSAHAISISQAVRTTDGITENLGTLIAGKPLYLVLAADDFTAESSAKVAWSLKVEGTNPGLKLSAKKGEYVILYTESLKSPGNKSGDFTATVTLTDTDKTTTSSVFTGTVAEAPAFKTTSLPKATSGKKYTAKIELKSKHDEVSWNIGGDIPEGFDITEEEDTKTGKSYLLITGSSDYSGTYSIDIMAENEIGYDSKTYTLQIDPVKPKIATPKGFQKTYSITANEYVYIDLSNLDITGSKPITLTLDDDSQKLGLTFNEETMAIEGTLTDIPSSGKLKVNLEAYNPYTYSAKGKNKPVTLSLTINIVPEVVMTASNLDEWGSYPAYGYDEDNDEEIYYGEYYAAPAMIGRAFSAKFEAEGAKKWDFIIKNMPDEEVNVLKDGQSIIKKLKGKFEGLTFSSDGTISGTPTNASGSYSHIAFYATASTSSGTVTSKWIYISMGYPPALDESALSEHAAAPNGTTTNIDLEDYLDLDNMKFYADGETEKNTYNVPRFKFMNALPSWIEAASTWGHWVIGNAEYGWYNLRLKVTPNFTDAQDMKSYPLEFTAINTYGEVRGTLTIDVQAAAVNTSTPSQQRTGDAKNSTAGYPETGDSRDTKEEAATHGGLKVIRERDAGEISPRTLGLLRKDGYEIAAVLPVMSVDVSGTYDLNVELDEGVRTGAEMMWLAFPDSGDGNDEKFAEFWDETGAEISGVPENRRITVSVWLNAGKVYAPVIAVKREVKL